MRYYLAVDIGASAGRHILAHIEGGKIIAEEIYRFSNTPEALPGTPGALGCQGGKRLMWNAKRLFREILNGLKKAGELGKAPYLGRRLRLAGRKGRAYRGRLLLSRRPHEKRGRFRSPPRSVCGAVRKDGDSVSGV